MTTTTDTPTALRARLAEFRVLDEHDMERSYRYGDMARARRSRELRRLRDALHLAGARISLEDYNRLHGFADESTPDELAAAWRKVAEPRIRRLERETYRADTRYTQASIAAWRATARRLGIAEAR